MIGQLPLALRWPAHRRFESFHPGPNGVALVLLREAARDEASPWLFLAGPRGSGRSHLLIATCAAAREEGRSAQYLSLATPTRSRAEAIRGIGGSDLVAIDDVEAIAGDAASEHALFDLHNRCRADNATLVYAASATPAALGLALPDLISRLSACTQIALKPLDEVERRTVLRERGLARGIELDENALDWLFTRRARDLASLLALLERIDTVSLAAQRRVTVPFLRGLIENSD